ncbi:MAG: YdcF family protein [Pseudolabrys sp.]|nr:YdcF family protein [Pseudolabrys sp.]MDP2294359.1 YdcF family protein [Pseudolabrys sp.]
MFFILSKTAGVLLRPSVTMMLIGLCGLLLLPTRWRRAGLRLLVTSFVLLLVAGVSPLAGILTHALEARFPKWDASRGAPDGVIVLGGALSPLMSRRHGEPVFGDDAGRLFAIARLARDYPQARIVYSGGDGTLLGTGGAEADYLRPLLDAFGVDPARVVLEPRSRNTAENAAFSKELIKPKPGERWLLVTSAQHMPRAVGSFRAAGFAVEAYPVAWRSDVAYRFTPNLGIGGNLARLDSVANEWVGLLAYWLTGRTSALWPAP